MLILLLFPFLFLLLSATPNHVSTTTNHLQQDTMDPIELQTLFTIMETLSSDHNWRLSFPNPCKPSTSWTGIQCKLGLTDSHLHVTRLDLGTPPNPTCKPTATFPSHIFQLPYLQSIFFFNCFTKTKTTLSLPHQKVALQPPPPSFSSSSLQQLSLRSNPSLVGPISPDLFSHFPSLQILTISQSGLAGAIPREISRMKSLVHLDLSYNRLTGFIPDQLCDLRSLVGLDLSYNSLTGFVPSSIGQLGMLQKLDLSSNSLTGSVPASIKKLSSLAFIALNNNKLHGKLPIGFENLKGLEYLIMDNNPMAVQLPIELGRLPKLQELRLAQCGFSGEIPATFSQLSNLTTLSLQNNRLTGNIPVGLGNLSRVYHLNLSRNFLSGEIPFDSGFLKRLGKNLDVSGNRELCLNPLEGGLKVIGVGVCDGNGSSTRVGDMSSSRVKPLKTSEGRVVEMSQPTLFFVFLGFVLLI